MIPVIQREIVTNKQWVSEEEFLDLIAVTQSAPGPVAVNTAVFIGYKLQGISGATVALLGSVLPSFLIILTLALFLSSLENNLILTRFLAGVRPAVAALILGVGLKMGFKALRSPFALL
ncbi:MAG TPA: chromate transporter, partial [Peptococcaceae bacterium]|nr:chromate transporter [Peptococcaceae bacterium]